MKFKRLEDFGLEVNKVRNLKELRKLKKGDIIILNAIPSVLRKRYGNLYEFVRPSSAIKEVIKSFIIRDYPEKIFSKTGGVNPQCYYIFPYWKGKDKKDYQECKTLLLNCGLEKN